VKTVNPANGRPSVPVLSSEWNSQEFNTSLSLDTATNSLPVVNLLNYMRGRYIPMGVDIGAVLSQQPDADSPQWIPSNYGNFAANYCSGTKNNTGLLLSRLFMTNYARPLTEADGQTPGQTTQIWCH
jgi:hypothetical protein